MRATRIIATVGPASDSPERLHALLAAGADIFRLNFSHGSRERHGVVIDRIRAAARDAGRAVAILQDLSGPKIRTGRLERGEPLPLAPGDALRIEIGDLEGRPGLVSTTYAPLAAAVRAGDRLLLDDGRIALRVASSDGARAIDTIVENGGLLRERKGINAPGVRLPRAALTGKDETDLAFGLAHGVDLVALSFVQSARDLREARDAMLRLHAATVPLIAKIERPEAVTVIDEVLDAADGLMVARGDLGLEIPIARVPAVQKQLTWAARLRGLPVIVATQVLESMTSEPLPTRAEASDAANAVHDGVDAVMLSGETAVGVDPVRAVRMLDEIIVTAETEMPAQPFTVGESLGVPPHNHALCEAALTLAVRARAQAIVAITRGGKTARVLAALRPPVPVFAATPSDSMARTLVLYRGVVPIVSPIFENPVQTVHAVLPQLIEHGHVRTGESVVLVGISADLDRLDSNFLRLLRVDAASAQG
ncbi:MAG: pyruvate kinase [Vicinamibacteraceae bacterium]|nr:pyruvate kinase [Vicinamibacteraceae bacterium]